MDIVKAIFTAIDKSMNKIQNNSYEIKGAENVSVVKDIQYSPSDIKNCVLDYYYPDDIKGPYPVIINIHGGGFAAGGKEFRRALCTWYATQGYFVVNINYGLCPECKFPTPLFHVVEAVEWVEKNAEKFNLDLKRVAVGGDSAGAYYACMIATLSTSKKLQNNFGVEMKLKFNGVILNCGIFDMDEALRHRMVFRFNELVMQSYLGLSPKELSDYRYKDVISPLKHINTRFPPAFVIYCAKDLFCRGQTEKMIEVFNAKDIYYESYHTSSLRRNHCFSLEWKSKEAKQANAMLKDFLKRLKNGEVPHRLSSVEERIEGEEKCGKA